MMTLATLDTLARLQEEMAAAHRETEEEALGKALNYLAKALNNAEDGTYTTGEAAEKLGVSGDELFPVRGNLPGPDQKKENARVGRFAVDAFLKYLHEATGSTYRRVCQPDEGVRDRPAPDWECANDTTGARIGLELVDDFSWDEQQAVLTASVDLGPGESVVVQTEHPRASLQRVILAKQKKGQLKDYLPGNRVLLVCARRGGASPLLMGIPVEELRDTITYMDAAPDIDHVFLWELTSGGAHEGVQVWHLWSRTALP